jgi:Electron transfer DM13/Prokaryotic membrane lipoprotein lipid attachment site
MKKYLFLFVSLLFLASCNKEDGNDPNAGLSTVGDTAVLKYSGTFNPHSGISASGNAKIYLDGTIYKLKLENISVSTGPDLKVYLSKAGTPSDFISLGALGTGSTLVYDIKDPVDFTQYKYVLIHCQQKNHLFAVSSLMTIN